MTKIALMSIKSFIFSMIFINFLSSTKARSTLLIIGMLRIIFKSNYKSLDSPLFEINQEIVPKIIMMRKLLAKILSAVEV